MLAGKLASNGRINAFSFNPAPENNSGRIRPEAHDELKTALEKAAKRRLVG